MTSTTKVEIRNRWMDAVLYTAEVPANTPSGLHMRVALEQAVEARVNLEGVNLAGANLEGVNLEGVNLAGANLEGANLEGADLEGVNLEGVNLAGANLEGANLEDANLAGAKWRDGIVITKTPIQLYGLTWPVTILDAHMQIGCQLHSLAEWSAFDDASICEMGGRDALRFWRENKDALFALARAAGRSFKPVKSEEAAEVAA